MIDRDNLIEWVVVGIGIASAIALLSASVALWVVIFR